MLTDLEVVWLLETLAVTNAYLLMASQCIFQDQPRLLRRRQQGLPVLLTLLRVPHGRLAACTCSAGVSAYPLDRPGPVRSLYKGLRLENMQPAGCCAPVVVALTMSNPHNPCKYASAAAPAHTPASTSAQSG